MRGGMREVGVVGFGNRGDIESMASNAQRRPLIQSLLIAVRNPDLSFGEIKID